MLAPSVATRRAASVHGAVGCLVAVVIVVALWLVGVNLVWAAVVAVVVGGAGVALAYLRQEPMVLRAVGAERVAVGAQPRLENLVAGLCVANGFREPALYLVRDAAPNILAVGRHPRHGALAVSTGLLERLGRVELEGVVAHELTRIRNRTTFLEVTVGVLIARPLAFAPSLAASIARRLLDPRTSAEVDVASMLVTRYPPGLAAALRSMRADGRAPVVNPIAFRHLWVDVPEGSLVPQDFSLDDRIAVLEEL